MAMDNAILDAFFEECEDLLASLVDGLAEMCAGTTDTETINAVFRAVHSIKGAAGAFSMDALVSFAHKFETVLDALRAGQITADDTPLKVLQRAGDVLSDLVEAERDGTIVPEDRVDPVLADLNDFLGDTQTDDDEAFSFEALSLDLGSADVSHSYLCTFTPRKAFYDTGHDPLLLIKALKTLGPVQVRCDLQTLPTKLADFDPQDGYLTWQVSVGDQSDDLKIREVFEFVDDLSDLQVTLADESADSVDHRVQSLPVEEGAALIDLPPPPASDDLPVPEAQNTQIPPKPATPDRGTRKSSASLRVDPERVDRLINAVGELIINQSVISQRIQEAALPTSSDIFSDLDDYKLLAREIQEGVMAIRAQPVKPLFQRMLRIAREAADATGKSVSILTEGEATEVDKTVVERLADPLTHMIRNAIDHGLEDPETRLASGKTETGTLRLTASQKSGSIVIEVSDDGAGLNRERIFEIAVEKGLIERDLQLSEPEIDLLLFAPGFSTASEITNLSGRGVGMDVVKTAITELGGKISIASTAGEGTTFTISLPLTLAVMDGMVINVGGQTMVVPIASIIETVRPTATDLATIGLQGNLLRIRGEYVPIIDLGARLGDHQASCSLTDKVLLLIQTEAVQQCALAVDEIFDQRQIVVKSMQGNYGEIPGISGATILGDGKIALIIDTDSIASQSPPHMPDPQNLTEDFRRVG
ncbi:chemotaxis protein CheA [Yoonia litorea]|uniref:Chemotaxis protein CheA n=1 Tax=Yoonia litorea TaxID=1123755 RepID=A0A1I6MI85_9RHOB|nr:chemotaxis protein CheA [Yoonia litorea]SFS15404.1 two-component system, chemotaxis family, sensor kinase CheA [Yoonia litorea]